MYLVISISVWGTRQYPMRLNIFLNSAVQWNYTYNRYVLLGTFPAQKEQITYAAD